MDGYKGYAKLYEPEPNSGRRLREAACWAHLRRDFHDFWTSTKSEIAREALDRIGKLYDIERDLNGQPADVRHATRQKLSKPKVEAFFAWSEQQLLRIPGKSDLAKAFRYGLSRQEAFSLFLRAPCIAQLPRVAQSHRLGLVRPVEYLQETFHPILMFARYADRAIGQLR